jgi:polysaccharide biosynthesis transport protein
MATFPPPEQNEGQIDSARLLTSSLRYVAYSRLMIICLAVGLLAGLVYYVFSRPTYSARALLRITVLGLPVSSDSGRTEFALGGGRRSLALRTFQQQLLSDHLQSRVAQKLGVASQGDSPESIRQFAIPRFTVEFVDADYLEVNVSSYFPHVVREFSQVLVTEYEAMEKETRDRFREKALASYISELDELKLRLDQALAAKLDFQEKTDIAKLSMEHNRLIQVPKEILQSEFQLQNMDDVRERLKRPNNGLDVVAKLSLISSLKDIAPIELGTPIRNPANGTIRSVQTPAPTTEVVVTPNVAKPLEPWQEIEAKLRALDSEITRESTKFQPGSDVMKKLNADRAELQDKLAAELVAAETRLELEHTQLIDKLADLKSKMPEYNQVTKQYEQSLQDFDLMQRGQIDWDKAYADLSGKVQMLQFGADKDRIQVEFSDMLALRDKEPVSPSKMRLAMIAAGLGLVLAIGLPTLLIMADTRVNRLQEVEERTGVKGIGVVPLADPKFLEDIFRSPTLDAKVPNFLLEAHRIIRSNITLHPNRQKKCQVVMVTSARPSEGKTTLACNLAWAFHSMGERVLLVDADLRRGRVAHVAQIPNEPGLASLLVNESIGEAAILQTRATSLDVIPRGPIVAGATELLCMSNFDKLMADWRTKYDRIILDTPPVLGLSESASLQRVVDGVVVVVRAHRTLMKDVNEALDMLKRSGAHLFGTVLNAVDLSKLANHYAYYYYSPSYYGEMETRK